MRNGIVRGVVVVAVSLAACSSAEDAVNLITDAPQIIQAMNDCFVPIYEDQAEPLVELMSGIFGRDPTPATANATVTALSNTSVSLTATLPLAVTLTATITFHTPDGSVYTANLSAFTTSSTIDEIIDAVATQMGQDYPGSPPFPPPDAPETRPFMVAAFTMGDGAAISGAGAFTGVIGGAASDNTQNELQELRTTEATPVAGAGIPPRAPVSISAGSCGLSFTTTAGLITDQTDDEQNMTLPEEFPVGTIVYGLISPTRNVTGSLIFDGTSSVTLVVDGIAITGTIDLNTGDVSL